jgi:hypothetical protein
MKTKIALVASVLFVVFVSILSCKKEHRMAPIQVLLTDKPATYDSVNVHIVGMEVQINHDTAAWLPINTKDSIYNLLDLQNGLTTLIAQDTVPAGLLQEVRFILGNDNTIVVNGVSYPLEAPSAEYSGLKVKIGRVLAETLNTFTLDFDAATSIQEQNGAYKLRPVIQMR